MDVHGIHGTFFYALLAGVRYVSRFLPYSIGE